MNKKISKIITGLLIALTTLVSAESSFHDSTSNKMSMPPEVNQNQQPMRVITPIAGPRVAHGIDLFVTASYLFWHTGVDLDQIFALTAKTTNVEKIGRVDGCEYGEFDWASGFKVALGMNLPHDGWDTKIEYTWLRPKGYRSTDLSNAGYPGISNVGFLLTLANSGWSNKKLDFNVIDWTLGRNFYVSQYFTMKPSVGLKGTWQNAEYSFGYAGNVLATPSFAYTKPIPGKGVSVEWMTMDEVSVKTTTKSWGIGPRISLDLGLFLTKSLSLYGKAAWTGMAHALYEKDDTYRFDNLVIPSVQQSTPTNVEEGNIPKTYYSCVTVHEVELGLQYDCYFSEDQYHLSIQAGWDTQVWSSWARQLMKNPDLTFMGLNVTARFDF